MRATQRRTPRRRAIAGLAPLIAASAALLGGGGTAQAASAAGELGLKLGAAGCLNPGGAYGCTPVRGGDAFGAVTFSPDGRSAYATGGGSIAVFDRGADGTLVQKPGAAGCLSAEPREGCTGGHRVTGAGHVTVSPDGRHAYVTDPERSAVGVLDRAEDGTLTEKPGLAGCISDAPRASCAGARGIDRPNGSVTLSSDGRSAYVVGWGSETVAVFDRGEDGRLTQKDGEAGCVSGDPLAGCTLARTLGEPEGLALSPDGRHAYVSSRSSDGADSAVLVFDRAPDGRLEQKAGRDGCFAETGSASCADGYALSYVRDLTATPDGEGLYVFSYGAMALLDRAPDGTLSQKPGEAGCIAAKARNTPPDCAHARGVGGPDAVAFTPDGRYAYFASTLTGSLAAFTRHDGGALTPLPGDSACMSLRGNAGYELQGTCLINGWIELPYAISVGPEGRTAYVAAASDSGDSTISVYDLLPDDARAPAIAIADPAEGEHVAQGAHVVPSVTCDDGPESSGVATCEHAAALDTSSPGARSFVVTATDRARNVATRTVRYVVEAPKPTEPRPPADATRPTFSIPRVNRTLRAAGGVVRFRLGALSEAAAGRVSLRTSNRVRTSRRARARTLSLGSRSYTATAGQSPTVRIRLGRTARRTLAARRSLRARATITARDAAGNTTVRAYTLRVKAPRRARR